MAFDPLVSITSHWYSKTRLGAELKGKRFQKDAEEGMRFFAGPYDWLYTTSNNRKDRHFKMDEGGDGGGEISPPRFKMTLNKVAELVQIFGPVLYHRNPNRQVNPREYPLPGQDVMQIFGQDPQAMMMFQAATMQGQQLRAIDSLRAKLLEYYLNYTPNALDLKTESRWAIVEALIKGAGCLWTEKYDPPSGGSPMVGSFYDSVDNLLIDPDAKTPKNALWISRRRCRPVWETERKYGMPTGYLKGMAESSANKALVESTPEGAYMRATGQTCDMIVYHEIYSKCGLGGRLTGIDERMRDMSDQFGDYCYLCVCPGLNHPLNVPPQLFDMEATAGLAEMQKRVQWPIPYWADGEWPVSMLGFHWIPEDPWPMSHVAPGMGELKFLNWMYSMIAGKIQISCRDIIAILEEAGDKVDEAIKNGADFEVVKIKGSAGKTINEIVQFLKHPDFNMDIWRVIDSIGEQFEKRVGLTELAYGLSSRQDRSATESATKRDQMNVRPDDMANRVEDWMSEVSRKEAIAARYLLSGQDVQSICGPTGAMMWDQFVRPATPDELLYSLEYRIEAGSVRKPNRDRDAQNAKDLMQAMGPFYQNIAVSTGLTQPWNQIVTLYCKANDIKPDGLLLPNIPVPAPPAGPPQGQAA